MGSMLRATTFCTWLPATVTLARLAWKRSIDGVHTGLQNVPIVAKPLVRVTGVLVPEARGANQQALRGIQNHALYVVTGVANTLADLRKVEVDRGKVGQILAPRAIRLQLHFGEGRAAQPVRGDVAGTRSLIVGDERQSLAVGTKVACAGAQAHR